MKLGWILWISLPVASVAAFLVIGCTSVNAPLNDDRVPVEARVKNRTRATTAADVSLSKPDPSDPSEPVVRLGGWEQIDVPRRDNDGCFVGIAISGGGSRSANFGAACMFQLQRLGLLQHVDYISSVSGGSLAAAMYCISDDEAWNPANVQRTLTHSFANDVIIRMLMPWNALALMFSHYDRSDLLADSFRRKVFSRDGRELTFADLRPDRPRLLINATDLQSGRPFVFCNESFDEINSDLSKYPLAHAVAASAAVPIVMHQVTLRDFSTTFKRFRHLIDGGINDNLGIETLVNTFEAQVALAERRGMETPFPNGAWFIILDAGTQYDARLDDKGDIGLIEGVAAGASATSTALVNRVSLATMAEIIVQHSPDAVPAAELRRQIKELADVGFLKVKDRRGHPVTVVHLSLSRVGELSELPSRGFFQRLNDIATYFNITESEAAALYLAADMLMRQKYEAWLLELKQELENSIPSPPAPTPAPARN